MNWTPYLFVLYVGMPSQELSAVVMVADTLIIIVVKKLSISEQEQKKSMKDLPSM